MDGPRERIERVGVDGLADADLIALVLGAGNRQHNAAELAAMVLKHAPGVAALSRLTAAELAAVPGIGPAQASRITAAFALGRRALTPTTERTVIRGPADVHAWVLGHMSGLEFERFSVLALNAGNRVIATFEVARGTLASVEVHPREVFRPLIRSAAAAAIAVHNHPSGCAEPSQEDVDLTHRLREAGSLLGIPLLDHVVVAGRSYRSVSEYTGPL